MRMLRDATAKINEKLEEINSLPPGSDDMRMAECEFEGLVIRYEVEVYAAQRAARRGQLEVT